MALKKKTPSRSNRAERDQRAKMAQVAKGFEAWKPATTVLTRVKAVPTIWPQLDIALRTGGWPIERVSVIHGPSNHGKTYFLHGLGLSFLKLDHYYAAIDAEMTTPEDWLRKIMGETADHPGFLGLRPESFEQTVDAVRDLLRKLKASRDAKKLDSETSVLIGLDSVRKLVPKGLLAKLEKQGSKAGVDGLGGRAAQIKAAYNAAWLDELVPLLAHTSGAMVFIAREEVVEKRAGRTTYSVIKLGGGRALEFDASLLVRVTRQEMVTDVTDRIVGEKHRVQIRKTKIAGKEDKYPEFSFHTSNGVLVPEGFDRARDLIDFGKECGAIVVKGSSYRTWDGEIIGKGIDAAVVGLSKDPHALAAIETEIRRRHDEG